MSTIEKPSITQLNDQFRKNPMRHGRLMLTAGVNAMGQDFVASVLRCIAGYENFPHGDDPYGEHDFGSFELDGEKLFWKIDYYDKKDPDLAAADPSNPTTTERVLTVMLASEY